ncbi:MAG: hypothetical protein ACREJX_05705 [Polyangiaceae bacterium]
MSGTGPSVVGMGDQRFMLEYTGSDESIWQIEYDFGFNHFTRLHDVNGSPRDPDVSSW